jgi:hypothetical protein
MDRRSCAAAGDETMWTRRDFLKTGALGAAALATGFALAPRSAEVPALALEGWLPADPDWLGRLLAELPLPVGAIEAPGELAPRLEALAGAGSFRLRVEPRPGALADFVLLEGGRLLDPVLDWHSTWRGLRAELAGRSAAWRISLVDRATDRPARHLRLTRWDGLREDLPLQGDGQLERLGRGARPWRLAIEAGELRVLEAPCRHELCRLQGSIVRPGQRLTCAPAGWTAELRA